MSINRNPRRSFLLMAAAGVAGLGLSRIAAAAPASSAHLPVTQFAADEVDFGYYIAGPEDGRPVILLHDAGGSIDDFAEVAPLLVAQGLRVLVPQLRGYGTRLRDAGPGAASDASPDAAVGAPAAPQQVYGSDVIALMDSHHIPEAVFAGAGLGARTAAAAALLKPKRCVGLAYVQSLGPAPEIAAPLAALPQSPQSAPIAFAAAVAQLVKAGKWRT
jgi:pimeloyl-ACP methyl ester carboxylesterase